MPINPRFSRLIAVTIAPILLSQARRVRRVLPDLPEAELPWRGAVPGTDPVSILVIGDSTAAGVGTERQDDALPGNLARRLSAEWERGVRWRAIGQSGATSADIVGRFLADASDEVYDLVFVSIGANDALKLRSSGTYRRNLRTILRRLRAISPQALIMVSCLPGFSQFASLPNPLRWALALHATNLEAAARRFVKSEPGVVMSPPSPVYTPEFFAVDRFHPSASGYREWVDFALTDAKLVRTS